VCKQFHACRITHSISSYQTASKAVFQKLTGDSSSSCNENAAFKNQEVVKNQTPIQTPYQNLHPLPNNQLKGCKITPEESWEMENPFNLPTWASTSANAVMAILKSADTFDIEGKYQIKPDFLKVLQTVKGASQIQDGIHYREVFSDSY
jgi:hypothetical protein